MMRKIGETIRLKDTKSPIDPKRPAKGKIIDIHELGGEFVYDVKAKIRGRGEMILSHLKETNFV